MLVSTDKKWDYALGMIKVDGLEPSPEFKKLIEKELSLIHIFQGLCVKLGSFNHKPLFTFACRRADSVSYTHLDVYKRQC